MTKTREALRERLLEEAQYWEVDGLEPELVALLREAAEALPSLGQEWVSRVTNSDGPEVSVMGAAAGGGGDVADKWQALNRAGHDALAHKYNDLASCGLCASKREAAAALSPSEEIDAQWWTCRHGVGRWRTIVPGTE